MDGTKRESILEAASRAFSRLGFKKTSIDQIARDAGVAKGTIYLACESKEDLFYQAVHRDLRQWIAEVGTMIDPRRPADELLGTIAVASWQYMERHPLVLDLIAGVYHEQLPAWAPQLEELQQLAHANIVEILRLGKRQGVFRPDLDAELCASLLQQLQLAGYVALARTGGADRAAVARHQRAGIDLVLNGLRTRSGPQA
jgi:AcrR family transcriptional regulator